MCTFKLNPRLWWSRKYNFVHQCAQTEMWVFFWPLNRVIKLTEINNALWVNSQELGVYRAHNLTQQQSIFWKGHGTLKSVKTVHMLLFFPDTVVSHFLPILEGIIPQRPWKHISGPFLHLGNQSNSCTKMCLFCDMDSTGKIKSGSPACPKHSNTQETKINKIHAKGLLLSFINVFP